MKHMPHFISDYGNGLFPIMEQSVLYKGTKCFSYRNKSFYPVETSRFIQEKQSVPTGCNKVFSTVN